jgi:hypothetical protein
MTTTVTTERDKFDAAMAARTDSETRAGIWAACDHILSHGPLAANGSADATGLALGYVQSGKTTTITALTAAAADAGYRVIVALLGSTNLLLDQNVKRIEKALTSDTSAYKWVLLPNAKKSTIPELNDWLGKDRVVVLPLLKHAGRINHLAEAIAGSAAADLPILIIDDEADQASLNTAVSETELSKTYASLTRLRKATSSNLYIQFTATPYAPLLLELEDHLKPEFITLLKPGPGYTGGREFFVDEADKVIRNIPSGDEQAAKDVPLDLPNSLRTALANFLVGAGMLLGLPGESAPVSMLVHSTQGNKVQGVYRFHIDRQLRKWREELAEVQTLGDLPALFREEYKHLTELGAAAPPQKLFIEYFKKALAEATTWLVNSTSDLKSIRWNLTPVHILVGGNKLDRGFTVEGLTVTYMNRPASTQIDTLEQRARAFGYRKKLLPYCQFFATPRTLQVLREIVFTEYDLRATLDDALAQGLTVHDWSTEIGLRLPPETTPSRPSVLGALSKFVPPKDGWIPMRQPSRIAEHMRHNAGLIADTGLPAAERVAYDALAFRSTSLTAEDLVEKFLTSWKLETYSAGWRHEDIREHLSRHLAPDDEVPLILMDDQDDGPRIRSWDELGFVNLFQGRNADPSQPDKYYAGDRSVTGPESDHPFALQVHYALPRGTNEPLFTLAVHLGTQQTVKKAKS